MDIIPLPQEAVTKVIQGGLLGNRAVEIARFGSSALAHEYTEWLSKENPDILFLVIQNGLQTRYRDGKTGAR